MAAEADDRLMVLCWEFPSPCLWSCSALYPALAFHLSLSKHFQAQINSAAAAALPCCLA